MKRVLLIGGSGRLGTAILQRWTDCEIVAPSHAELALEQTAELRRALARIRPDVLVNAAAFHDVDRCEGEPEPALTINALAVGKAASLAREHDTLFVTVSSDYVFDGEAGAPYDEGASPRPLSIYGMSKLIGERLVERSVARAFVVRTCGLYGIAESSPRHSLIDRVLACGTAGSLRIVADVIASPTFAGDLATALRRLIETQAYGLVHAVNAGAVSWYDFARTAAALAGSDVAIEPITAREWKSAAIRPRYSALANAKLESLGIAMPSWRDGIAAYLENQVR